MDSIVLLIDRISEMTYLQMEHNLRMKAYKCVLSDLKANAER